MKQLISILLLFVFGYGWGQSKEITPPSKSIFWKISTEGGESVSYLFGTIHLIDKDLFVLPETVKKQLKQSDKVFLELDDLANTVSAMKLALLKEGKMTDMLSQAQKDSVYGYVEGEFGMDSISFEKLYGKFKPFFFAQLGMMKMLANSESYDKTFGKIADENDIDVIGLETMEEQVSFFDAMPIELQKEMVMQTVRNKSDAEELWKEMQLSYLNQDIEKIAEMDNSSHEMKTYMETVLMKNRNEKWIYELIESLDEGHVFIGVGAAHLVGEFGLIQLLRENGYILEPIEIQLTK